MGGLLAGVAERSEHVEEGGAILRRYQGRRTQSEASEVVACSMNQSGTKSEASEASETRKTKGAGAGPPGASGSGTRPNQGVLLQ